MKFERVLECLGSQLVTVQRHQRLSPPQVAFDHVRRRADGEFVALIGLNVIATREMPIAELDETPCPFARGSVGDALLGLWRANDFRPGIWNARRKDRQRPCQRIAQA